MRCLFFRANTIAPYSTTVGRKKSVYKHSILLTLISPITGDGGIIYKGLFKIDGGREN